MGKKEKGKGKSSVKAKLMGTILPVVLIIVIALIVVSYSVSRRIIKEESENLLGSSISSQAAQIESWLQNKLAAFDVVKADIEGTHPDDAALQELLDQYCDYDSSFPNGLYVADQSGNVIQAKDAKVKKKDVLDSVWYTEGLTRVNLAIGPVSTDEEGTSIVSASGIINDGTNDIRVLSVDVPIDQISIIVNSYIEMNDAQAILVDTADGSILACDDSSLMNTKIADASSSKILSGIATKIAQRDYTMCEMNGYLTDFKEISGTDWLLVSYVADSSVYGELSSLRNIMILISAISILLLAILIERVIHVVIRPINALTKAIVSMSAGDFTIEVNTRGEDEIAVMGKSVMDFIASMRAMIIDIMDVSERLGGQADSSKRVSDELRDASQVQAKSMGELETTEIGRAHV